jgi:hypothetical protein
MFFVFVIKDFQISFFSMFLFLSMSFFLDK